MIELRLFKCHGHLVILQVWSLTCDVEKYYFARYYFVMCNLEKWLRYSHCFYDIGLTNYHQSHHPLNMDIKYNIPRHVVTSMMMSSWSKWFSFTQFAIWFSYLNSNWKYNVQNMDFEYPRKRFGVLKTERNGNHKINQQWFVGSCTLRDTFHNEIGIKIH